ncbi:type VII secretion integral membrane protein EccD [Catellatospora citrea]|nr:type VII secretion integral membrane protein EccD [Catellatospora citrea]RKE10661.1 type VII secretion integral membrane protein EccD [Catellatospora citrea]
MCRLVVCGPDRRIEVAVPSQVLIADLLPVLLQHLGGGLADTGLDHGGWVLQRLGGPPLDDEASASSLGLHDGDVVYLRPRESALAVVHFDDLIDGIATGVRQRSGVWQPQMARWVAFALLAVVFCIGLLALAQSGPVLPRAMVAGGIAAVTLVAAYTATSLTADRWFGLLFALAAIMYAGLAGALAPAPDQPTGPLSGPQLFCGAVAALAVAALAALLVGWAGRFFAALLATSLVAVTAWALVAFVPLTVRQAAGVVAVAVTVAMTVVPTLAFRLAGLRLAPLPTEPEHLQQDIDPEPSAKVLQGAARTDAYMTALHTGLAIPAAAFLVLLGSGAGWAPLTLTASVALVRMLACRPMNSLWHRMALALPAIAGLSAVALSLLTAADPGLRAGLVGLLVAFASPLLFVLARKLPGRRIMPYWGQAADVAQTMTTVAMFPLLLAVLDVYGSVRALWG